MHTSLVVLLFGCAAIAALPTDGSVKSPRSEEDDWDDRMGRIVGGSLTTINQYPFAAALLAAPSGSNYRQSCGGTILNNRSILSAAHCFHRVRNPSQWRSRIGSSFAGSGGRILTTSSIRRHPNYNAAREDNDFAIIQVSGSIGSSSTIQRARIAGPSYSLGDRQVVRAIGWGHTRWQGSPSNQLRHVQIWTVNQNTCVQRYRERNMVVTANMLCSGWLDVGGRDQCSGDSGSPLLHNRVVVGVCSWGHQCGLARFPGVNARVSRASTWISNNA